MIFVAFFHMEYSFEGLLLGMVKHFDWIQNEISLLGVKYAELIIVFEKEHFLFKLDYLGVIHVFVIQNLHYLKLVEASLYFFGRFQAYFLEVRGDIGIGLGAGHSIVEVPDLNFEGEYALWVFDRLQGFNFLI